MSQPIESQAPTKPIRLGYLVTHPIQYQIPLLRLIAQEPNIKLKVLFMSDFSLKGYKDPGFGTTVQWDVPLLGGYEHEFIPYRGKASPIQGFNQWHLGVRSILKREKFDVLWSHGYALPTNLRFLSAAKSLGVKTMVRADSQIAGAQDAGLKRSLKEATIRQLFRRFDAFLTIGALNHDYYAHYGVPEEKMFLLPFAVDNEFFQSKVRQAHSVREQFRAELGLQPGRPVILFASKLIKRKRTTDLIKAYSKLSPDGKQEPKPYLLILGDGEQRQSLESQAEELGWDSVKFLGFKNQTELPAFFDLCDVFVLPAEKEPWGLIVNEVMNAGKAIVLTKEIGATPDLVRHNENGFIFDTGNIEQLAEGLAKLTDEPSLAAKMGQKGLERINQWGFQENIRGLHRALKHLLPERF